MAVPIRPTFNAYMIYMSFYDSPVGKITLAGDDKSISELWIDGQSGSAANAVLRESEPITEAKRWLDSYFSGKNPDASQLSVALCGNEFRKTVWSILSEIPYGHIVTYGDVARETAARLGKDRMSAQAVGGAVGHNPVSIIIPCHRVIGAHGALTGYAGGTDLKIKLLALEGVDVTKLHI